MCSGMLGRMKRSILLLLLLVLLPGLVQTADAAAHNAKAKADFRHQPANDTIQGTCPGYVIDHVAPLCAGGSDRPSNMQWQTISEAKVKGKLNTSNAGAPGRMRSAANDPLPDPDDDPVLIFVRPWLLPVAIGGVVCAIAVVAWLFSSN